MMTLTERPAAGHAEAARDHVLWRYSREDARECAMIYLAGGRTSAQQFAAGADPEHIRAVRTGEGLLSGELLRIFEPAPDDGSTERMSLMIAEAMRELEAEGFDAAAYMLELRREHGTGAR